MLILRPSCHHLKDTKETTQGLKNHVFPAIPTMEEADTVCRAEQNEKWDLTSAFHGITPFDTN